MSESNLSKPRGRLLTLTGGLLTVGSLAAMASPVKDRLQKGKNLLRPLVYQGIRLDSERKH
jgi:hypothetical protein